MSVARNWELLLAESWGRHSPPLGPLQLEAIKATYYRAVLDTLRLVGTGQLRETVEELERYAAQCNAVQDRHID